MKIVLICGFLLLFSSNLWAQISTSKGQMAQTQLQNKFNAAHKIKEEDIYLITNPDSLTGAERKLIAKNYYDKKGTLIKRVLPEKRYSKAMPEGQTFENVLDYIYTYDDHHRLIKQVNKGYGFNPGGRDVTIDYEYDKKGNIAKLKLDEHMMIMYNKEKLGYICTFLNDANGNIIAKNDYDLDGNFVSNTSYDYDDQNLLIRSYTSKRKSSELGEQIKYNYEYSTLGSVKTEYDYNDHDSLMIQKEFVYNLAGEQNKGYQIKNGERKLVWNYVYDDKGRVIESTGGPADVFALCSGDIRYDGLAHLFYSYDANGLLTEIKKYEMDKQTNKEKLTAIERLVYTKY